MLTTVKIIHIMPISNYILAFIYFFCHFPGWCFTYYLHAVFLFFSSFFKPRCGCPNYNWRSKNNGISLGWFSARHDYRISVNHANTSLHVSLMFFLIILSSGSKSAFFPHTLSCIVKKKSFHDILNLNTNDLVLSLSCRGECSLCEYCSGPGLPCCSTDREWELQQENPEQDITHSRGLSNPAILSPVGSNEWGNPEWQQICHHLIRLPTKEVAGQT